MENEWIPSEEEYNPEITKEQWIELIQDKNIFNENSLITFACIQKAKVATCADMAEDFGRNTNFYNSNVWRTGERIYKKINCPLWQRENGTDRFWSVCCFGRDLKNGRFEFKVRPELQEAFEETGILEGVEVIEKKTSFTWIPFYTEMAEKLLEYKDNRKELVKIVYGMDEEDVSFFKDDKKKNFKDLHPFALYGIFNRQILPYKKIRICTYLKDKLQIKSNIPSDFDGLPTVNNQNSWWGMPWSKNDASKDIKSNWELFEIIQEKQINEDDLKNEFNFILSRGGAKKYLTMALYWIRPYEFMPLDSNSREYLQKIGINVFNEKDLNGQNYLDLCELIKDKIANNEIKEKSIPEISNNAWIEAHQGDTQMTHEDTLVKKYANLLKNTKNLILTGAPGTGKTYLAKQIAKELGCKDDNIGFVQFHPSYDYTDFVEGLRPTDKDGNGNVGFERKDGVFKEFCARALENLVETPLNNDENQNFDEAWEKLLDEVRENIAAGKLTKIGIWEYGLSSTNSLKYESTDTQSKYTFTITKKNVFDAYRGIKARPSGYFQKYMKEVADYMKKYGLKEYKEKSGPEKEKKSFKNFVFIIDEINRGEVAKIFGELFYSVDPGYRVTSDDLNAIKNGNRTITTIKTQYANLETEGNEFDKVLQKKEKDFGHFFIPENVYIIGTMNDIDRSVESMDFAFRRRFIWAEVKAKYTQYMLDIELDKDLAEKAKRRMENLNSAISEIEGLNEAYHIGASYFLKLKNYDGDFECLWEYHIKGILQEYLRGNPNGKLEDLKAAYDK